MRIFGEWARRIWYFLNRRRLVRELEHEMAAHRAELDDPRRFGSTLRLREEAADAWGWTWIDDLVRDLRCGARQLLREPRFTVTALAVLTLGAGVTLGLLHIANAATFHRLSIPDAEVLVRVSRQTSAATHAFPFPAVSFFREHATLFSYLVSENAGTRVSLDDDAAPLLSSFVSENYFIDLGVTPAHGRVLGTGDAAPAAHPVAMLGHRYWHRRFAGDAGVVGRVVRLNGEPVQIVGIAPPDFDGLAVYDGVAIWLPMAARQHVIESGGSLTDFSLVNSVIYGKLARGVTEKAAAAQLTALTRELQAQQPAVFSAEDRVEVTPVIEGRFEADTAILYVLFVLILLSACANLGNMLLARGVARAREIDTRVALGAGTGRVIRQLMTENLLLATLGSAAGTAAGYICAQLLLDFWELPPGLHIVFDSRMVLASVSTVVVSVLGFGLAPAIRAVRRGRGTVRARQVFVAAQVAASCLLLILATLLARAAERLEAPALNIDFTRTIVVDPQLSGRTLSVPAARRTLDDMTARLQRLPGVDGVAVAATEYLGLRGLPVVWNAVSPSYFDTLGLPVVRGRTFVAGEVNAAMVSESVASALWPDGPPLDRTLQAGRAGNFIVVGIVRDTGVGAFSRFGGAVYVPLSDRTLPEAVLFVHGTGNPRTLLKAAVSAASLSGVTPTVAMMESVIDFPTSNGGDIIGLLGVAATVLAFVGIAGLITFAVAQRTREIGIRMALGARRAHILETLLAQYAKPLAVGAAVGVALAMAGGQILRSKLYGLTPLDPASYAAGLLAFAAVAVMAILIPARRALRIEPASALRWE